jgi:uncharacterized protein YvpB
MVAVLLAGPLATIEATQPVAAQATGGVNAWVDIGSVRPAPGCWVETSVEVHESGYGVSGVEVGVALVLDGEILSLDRAVTDENGVAWVGFDTSGTTGGTGAWLDVLLGGAYVGGSEIAVLDEGACAGEGRLLEVSGEVALTAAAEAFDDSESASEAAYGSSISAPTYAQQRNLSCEYASLVIAMGAFGVWANERDMDSIVGWSANPHWGYRGDINGWWGNTDDYGVYAEALTPVLDTYGFAGDVFYGGDAASLTARLDQGMPTLVWLGLWGDTGFYEYTEDGTAFLLVPGAHVVVAYGYDASGVYVSDPALGDTRWFGWDTFLSMWNVFNGMSLAVAPYA